MISIVLDRVDKREYATFKSVAEMRQAVNEHVRKIEASDLSASWKRKLIRLLDYLRDESRTYPGLSFKRQRKIAEHFGLKKPDTIGIWLKKLAELGIVKILPTKRSRNMNRTSNFVQILPVEEKTGISAKAVGDKNGEHEDNNFIKTKSFNKTYQPAEAAEVVQRIKSPYMIFRETVQSLLGNADSKTINRLYGVYLAKTKRSDLSESEALAIGLHAVKTALQASKRKRISNLAGYLSGTISRMLDRLNEATTPVSKRQPIRKEVIPTYINEEYTEPTMSDEERLSFEEEKRLFMNSLAG